jgi:predicted ester cyclase
MSLKTFIRAYYDNAVNTNQPKTRASMERYVSDEALLAHVDFYESAFPLYQLHIEDMLEEGDKVFVRARFQGTHKGVLNGIAPTGVQVTLPVMLLYRIENGKIAQFWMEANVMTLLEQLGVTATSAQPA